MKGKVKLALVIVFLLSLTGLLIYNSQISMAIHIGGEPHSLPGGNPPGGNPPGGGGGGAPCSPAKEAECRNQNPPKSCLNEICFNTYVAPPTGIQCTSNQICTDRLGSDWECRTDWKMCVRKLTAQNPYMVATPSGDIRKCEANSQGGNPVSPATCVETVKVVEISECFYAANLTKFGADDSGYVKAGGQTLRQHNGPPASNFNSISPPIDITTRLKASNGDVEFSATDVRGAPSGQRSRWVGAAFTFVNLNPAPAQKCAIDPADNKVKLVPKCANTVNSCSKRSSTGIECAPCPAPGLFPSGGPTTSCQGNNLVTIQPMTRMEFQCSANKKDPLLGEWVECNPTSVGGGQTTTSVTPCKYGCSNGKCNSGKPPVLSSITVSPTTVSMNDTINVTSVASDPDNIVAAGGSTGGGTSGGGTGPGGSCPGGGTPPAGCSCIVDDHTGKCFKCTARYQTQLNSAVDAASSGPYMSGGSVIVGRENEYFAAVVSNMQSAGFRAAMGGDEISIRMPSDTFDEAYDILTAETNSPRKFYASTCSPPVDTAGMAVSDPTFNLIITADATNDITGSAAGTSPARKEKIKLECATGPNGPGTGSNGTTGPIGITAVCKGGVTTPRVELNWSIPAGATVNTILKRLDTGSFTDNPQINIVPGKNTYTDSAVQLNKRYVYRYKATTTAYAETTIMVDAASCTTPPTAGAVVNPTFPITGEVTLPRLPITGNAVCPQWETNTNPAVRLGVTIFHYEECPDGTTENSGPMKVGCSVTLDSTPKDASNTPTNVNSDLTWSCTGPFQLTRSTCFTPKGKITGEGPITCTGTLGTGLSGSITFQAGQTGGQANGQGGTTGTGGSPVPVQNIKWSADLCTSGLAEKNPSCIISKLPAAWASGGKKTIYCRVRDESNLLSDVKSAEIVIDKTPPTSVIVSPAENSVQKANFVVKVTDNDDVALDKCFYQVNNGPEKTRTCNNDVSIGVGPGRDCSNQGVCVVSVSAIDKSGNKNQPVSRSFAVKFLFTNITSPFDGSVQSRDFVVTVEDRNFIPANLTNMDCTYDVYNVSSTRPVKTVDHVSRNCSGEFVVSVGPDGDCNMLGQGACKVVSRVNGTTNTGASIEDTNEKFYTIDWITPSSKITSRPTGWVKNNTAVFVEDDPSGSNITECQYRVVSNGTETVGWKRRNCGAPGSPMELRITVGPGKDCRHEGGKACRVFVRPLDRAGHPGISDNTTIAVTFEDVNVDGFSLIRGIATKRGINFTGRTRQELRVATFFVCNSDSTVSNCIDAYNNEQSGVDYPNYCGSLMLGGEGKCELRCNDMTADYYFAARGQPLTGPIQTVTVISPLQSTLCPEFRIGDITALLETFRQLEEMLNIQIMMVDQFIQEHGEDDTNNNETLEVLREALLLTVDHIDYMEETMRDLDVDKAAEIIERSNDKLDEINALLLGVTQPTIVRLTVNMPAVVKYNITSEIPAYVNVSGPNTAYAKAYCSLLKPGGAILRNTTRCIELDAGRTDFNMQFYADTIGTWSYSCLIGRSARSDCSFEVNSTPLTGTFAVQPGLGGFVESLDVPATVVRGRSAVVTATVRNRDDVTRFANVRCDFVDSQNFLRRNSSACVEIAAESTRTTTISMVADRLGNWTVEKCAVFGSPAASCEGASLDNVSNITQKFEVKLPTDVYIDSYTLPDSPVLNDTTVQLGVTVQNPTAAAGYVILNCKVERPSSPSQTLSFEARKGIEARGSNAFSFDIFADVLGTWTVSECSTKKSTNPDYSNPVETYMLEDLGDFEVEKGTELTFTSFNIPSQAASGANAVLTFNVKNPSNTRFGRVSCDYRTPQNALLQASSACVQINEDATVTLPLNIFVSSPGVWSVESCSALASISEDCSSPATHDTIAPVGSFVSSGAVGTQTVELSDILIESVEAASAAYTNSRTHAIVSVKNINPVNSTYANVNCAFTQPSGLSSRQTSSCYQINPGVSQLFGIPVTVNAPGTWTVSGCYVNASSASNCAFSRLHNRSTIVKTIEVSAATDLYIKSVDAPDSLIVNNTEVPISFVIENPLNDDKFGSATCVITSPTGGTTTKTTPCVSLPRSSSKTQNVSVFANVIGTWVVTSCNVKSSTNSACTGGATTGELRNGDVFNVIRGYNLIFSAFNVEQPNYISAPVKVAYTVNNPSSSERFAKVTCSLSKGGTSITNSTPCFAINPEAFVSSTAWMQPNSLGAWAVTCDVSRSTESDCSAAVVDHSMTKNLVVENPPDVHILSINIPPTVRNKKPFDTVLSIKNPGVQRLFGYVGCTYKNFLNETTINTSVCTDFSRDTSSAIITFTPSYKGAWTLSSCFVNAGNNSDCTNTRRHNLSTEVKNFASSAPILSIEEASLSSTNLLIGDIIDIAVAVGNNDEVAHVGFVNCSVINPNNVLYRLTSPNQTIQADEVKVFHPKRVVDVAGVWRLASCSAYSINSPPVLQDTLNTNQSFNVTIPEEDQCSPSLPCAQGKVCQNGRCVVDPNACSISTCPGVNSACFCSGNRCMPCESGFTCQNSRCVRTIAEVSCLDDEDCPSGLICLAGFCAERPPQCFLNSDCPEGLECIDQQCKAPGNQPVNSDVVTLLIIILSAITIPVILFIYIKRVI